MSVGCRAGARRPLEAERNRLPPHGHGWFAGNPPAIVVDRNGGPEVGGLHNVARLGDPGPDSDLGEVWGYARFGSAARERANETAVRYRARIAREAARTSAVLRDRTLAGLPADRAVRTEPELGVTP
jgi:hypothetical protein